MQYDRMERYYKLYIKGLYSNGWRQIYAGDDGEAARESFMKAVNSQPHTSLTEIKSYYKGAILPTRTISF